MTVGTARRAADNSLTSRPENPDDSPPLPCDQEAGADRAGDGQQTGRDDRPESR